MARRSSSSERRRQYMEMMHHRAMFQVNECLAVCLRSPRSEDKWRCVQRDHHLELYAKKNNPSQSVFYLGMNQIHCSFDEVFDLLNFQTTAQFRLMMKLLYARNFRDGALMATQAPRDYDDDYAVADVQHSAVWFTLQDGRESVLGKDNMLAFFQALMVLHPDRASSAGLATSTTAAAQQPQQQFARPSEGIHKRTLALAWLPLTHQDHEVNDLRATVRLQYTLIVEEVSRHRLRLSCVATSFQDGDDLHAQRSATSRQIAKRLVKRSIACLESAVIAARISAQPLTSRHQWVRNQDRAACVVCWKPFNALLRRRHHCRACGEVVCGSCSSQRSTTTLLRHSQKLEKVRVCHICSNRGGTSARRQRRSQSFGSSHQQVGASTMDSILATSHSRPQRLINDEEGTDAFTEDEDVGNGSGYYGAFFVSAAQSSASSSATQSSQKLISLRSMTRADLLARSTSTTSSWKQSDSSTTSSVANRPRGRRQIPPPPPFVGRSTNNRRPPPPPPPPGVARQAAPYYGHAMLPPHVAQKQAEFLSLSFLHPAALNPERTHVPPKSIIADIGSYDPPPAAAVPASHERPSAETPRVAMVISDSDRLSDVPRRTSILSLAMLESCVSTNTSNNNSGGLPPRLDPTREHHRLKLMRVICSPACTLVDRSLMRECCEVAAATCGVRGAFIARVEETYVVLEHVVGTAKLSAIDHFLRSDTPCDFVLGTPTGEPLFRLADCSNDKRTSSMIMVRDVTMKFFIGVSICVRGLPIACLCAFSEDGERDDSDVATVDGSERTTSMTQQSEFQALEHAAHRIELELQQLVHGLNIT